MLTEEQKEYDLTAFAVFFANGYNEEVKAFTTQIAGSPKSVMGFSHLFEELISDYVTDWESPLDVETLTAAIFDERDALNKFLAGSTRVKATYLIVKNHGNEITVECGWHDSAVGPVLWNRCVQPISDPALLFAEIAYFFDEREYVCEPKPKEKSDPILYRYHPERFRAFRNYSPLVSDFYKKNADLSSGLISLDGFNFIIQCIQDDMWKFGAAYPRKLKDSFPPATFVVDAEISLAPAHGRFEQAGKQIFDFPPELVAMFAQTDVNDIPLNVIRLPYSTLYLHFGPQQNFEFEPGWLFDGAYVESRGEAGDIRFTLTTLPKQREWSRLWHLMPEVEFCQDFIREFRDKSLSEAIEATFSSRLAYLRDMQKNGMGGDIIENGLSIFDTSRENSRRREQTASHKFPIYKAALQLVVNALCYLTAYPDDIEHVWPEGTPESMKKKTSRGTAKEQARAKSKLASMGYSSVHLCGKNFAAQHQAISEEQGDNKKISLHWRKGHWRNQPYGQGRSLRKLIWLMPVLVGKNDERVEPEAGHIYRAEGE